MQRPIEYHSEAEIEVVESAEWYEQQKHGLGGDFLDELNAAITRIQSAPETFGYIHADVHCHLLHRFPFGILYIIEPKGIFIVAVMHLHREPEYWKHRLEE